MVVKVLYLITFLDAVGMSLVLPLINPHVQTLGGSLSISGVLNSLGSGAQLFASPVIGSWSDTRGRKLLLLSTLAMVFVSNILSGIYSLPMFFIARILYGAAHQTDPLVKAIIADRVAKEELTDIFNKLMAIGAAAFMVAPILGGILYQTSQNFLYLSIILCTLDIITISISFLFVEESTKSKNESNPEKSKIQETTFWQSIYADLSKVFVDLKSVDWSRYGNLLAIKFFLEAAYNLLFMNLGVVLLEKFEFTQTQLGLSITYMSLVMITSNLLSVAISKKFYTTDKNGFQRIVQAFTVSVGLFCAVPFANSPSVYFSIFIPLFIAKSLADSTWMEVLSNKTTEKDKGVMMGAASSMVSLSGLICPLIGGFTGDFIGITAVTMLPIFPTVLGTILVNKLKYHSTFTAEKID